MTLDPISQKYVGISFAIERLFPGFVDAYMGPEELKDRALHAPAQTATEIRADVEALAAAVATGPYSPSRQRYLQAQLRAMAMVCRRLTDEPVGYLDEVRACFDIEPEYTPESVFDAAMDQLNDLLPGEGDIRERMIAWRATRTVTPEVAQRLIGLILEETRRRTAELVTLPAGDEVEIRFVSDQPWSGYNWYLGNAKSRVEVNTDLPIHAHTLTGLIAHEAYPGHHTEHSLKERILFQERGYGEHSIQLINTPQCVIAEGIATLAESIIFPGDESERWQALVLYPAAGLTGDPVRESKISQALHRQRAVSGNAAIKLHAEGAPEDEVVSYLMRYALKSEAEARQSLRFIADPLWRPYTFTYHVGRDLLSAWMATAPDQAARRERFVALLTGQHTPGALAAEIAGA